VGFLFGCEVRSPRKAPDEIQELFVYLLHNEWRWTDNSCISSLAKNVIDQAEANQHYCVCYPK
jgi:hypothetical protein